MVDHDDVLHVDPELRVVFQLHCIDSLIKASDAIDLSASAYARTQTQFLGHRLLSDARVISDLVSLSGYAIEMHYWAERIGVEGTRMLPDAFVLVPEHVTI
ncbi:hypothetical protein ACYPKM_00410 [Pseudomonas aeruginosa]